MTKNSLEHAEHSCKFSLQENSLKKVSALHHTYTILLRIKFCSLCASDPNVHNSGSFQYIDFKFSSHLCA